MENLVRLRILSMNIFNFIFVRVIKFKFCNIQFEVPLAFKFLGNEDSEMVDNVVVASTCRSCTLPIYTVN